MSDRVAEESGGHGVGGIRDRAGVFTSDASKFGVAALMILVPLVLITTGTYVGYPSILILVLEVGVLYLLYSLVILGLNLQYGFTGLVNFGPVLFFALGMYGTAILTAENAYRGASYGITWPIGLLGGILLAGIIGVVISLSTVRLREDFLGIVTLAAAEIFHTATLTLGYLGSSFPISGSPRILHDATVTTKTAHLAYFLIYGAILLVAYTVANRLVKSPYGRTMRAIRADDTLVESVGKNPMRYKIVVFTFGAILAGLAGGMFTLFGGSANPTSAAIIVTMIVWVGMLIGGPGNNLGVLGGLAIVMGIQLTTRWLNVYLPVSGSVFGSLRLIVLGALLILIIRYKPEGLWGDADRLGRYE
ncbi:branched-chain amino acid ABC transporter permease [Saliphagus sp. GCM10025334]